MKINAQELVLLNRRNMRNGESAPQTTTETTTTNPEATMNALYAEGMKNISFQSVNASVLKNLGKKALIPLVIAGGAILSQSCDKDMWNPNGHKVYPDNRNDRDTTVINITNEVVVNNTVKIINNTETLEAILLQMLQNDLANAQVVQDLLEEIKALREDLNNGLADLAEAQERDYQLQLQVFDLMKLSYANDLEMSAKLTSIEARIEEIEALVDAGNLSHAEAAAEIKKLLEGISGKLDGILGAINDVKSNVEKLVEQGKLNNTQNELIISKLDNLLMAFELGQIDQENAFLELYGISTEILNQMIENNKYNSEALSELNKVQAQLAEILIAVQKGNMDVQTGFDKINELLGQLSGQLDEVIAMLHGELNKVNEQLNKLVEQGYINSAQNETISEQIAELTKLVEAGQIDQAEAFAKMFDISKQILNQLIVNNMQNTGIQAQLYAIQVELGNIENAIKNNTLTYEEGNAQIQELIGKLQAELEGINGSLDEIIAMFKGELNKVNEQLNKLVEQGYINSAQNQTISEQIAELTKLVEAGQIAEAEALAGIFDINKSILQQLIDNNSYNLAFKELLAEIQQDLADIEYAVKNQKIEVEVGTDQIEELIKGLSAQLDKIQATLDSLLKEVSLGFGMVEAYNKSYEANWNKLMQILANFDGNISALVDGQKDIKTYLDEQLKQLYAIKDLIKKIDVTNGGNGSGNSGLTVEQLKVMLKDLGDYYYAAFENFVKNNAVDTGKIEDLLVSIDNKIGGLKNPIDYSNDLAKIVNILQQLAARPDYNEKLDKIIELLAEFECNCNCNCSNGGSNEGIIEDLEDMLG